MLSNLFKGFSFNPIDTGIYLDKEDGINSIMDIHYFIIENAPERISFCSQFYLFHVSRYVINQIPDGDIEKYSFIRQSKNRIRHEDLHYIIQIHDDPIDFKRYEIENQQKKIDKMKADIEKEKESLNIMLLNAIKSNWRYKISSLKNIYDIEFDGKHIRYSASDDHVGARMTLKIEDVE